jgi:hypothetical protein
LSAETTYRNYLSRGPRRLQHCGGPAQWTRASAQIVAPGRLRQRRAGVECTGQPRENRECDCGQTGVLTVAEQWAPGGSESKFLSFNAHDGYIVP